MHFFIGLNYWVFFLSSGTTCYYVKKHWNLFVFCSSNVCILYVNRVKSHTVCERQQDSLHCSIFKCILLSIWHYKLELTISQNTISLILQYTELCIFCWSMYPYMVGNLSRKDHLTAMTLTFWTTFSTSMREFTITSKLRYAMIFLYFSVLALSKNLSRRTADL